MIHALLLQALRQRKEPLRVGVIGCGWFGGGTIKELLKLPNLRISVVIDADTEKAAKRLTDHGVRAERIVIRQKAAAGAPLVDGETVIVADTLDALQDNTPVDVVCEATGDVLMAATSAVWAIDRQCHFVTVTSEMDATLGLILAQRAQQAGVVYSNLDGDQPGVIARMINEAMFLGFAPRVVGSCKGFLDNYQTPEGVRRFAPAGQSLHKICSFADGTKMTLELACVANGYGCHPLRAGMIGPTTPSKQALIATFDAVAPLDDLCRPHIDFIMGLDGVDQGAGVFVVAKREGQDEARDLRYLKKGDGPYYLFFRDHHLCYFEAPVTILEAALFGSALLVPRGRYVDVASVAKRDISAGQRLDGIGGTDCYARVDNATACAKQGLLPLGLASFATSKRAIAKDTPITYQMVELEDNLAVRLRRKQETLPLPAD